MIARHRLPKKNIRNLLNSRLRKWLFPIILLVLFKIACLFPLAFKQPDFSIDKTVSAQVDNATQKAERPASRPLKGIETEVPDEFVDVDWNYDLIKEIQQREAGIRSKQEALKKEEERLYAIKKEIEAKIEEVSRIEKKIEGLIAQKKAVENEKVKKLAKVFEATPPEQAGPLLSKLDVDIAAQLLIMMQGRKAGRIWGFVDPDKAVLISKELARLKPDLDLDKIGGK